MPNKKLILDVGKKFNKWKIISHETIIKNNLTHWLCECECGKEEYVPLNNLMNENSTQCRICASKGGGLKRRKGYEEISGNHWAQLKSQAKRKKIDFNIRIEEAWKIYKNQHEQCAFTGKKIDFSSYPYNPYKNTAVLDRINPEIGFTKENCQWIHKDVARIKPQDMSKKDFLNLITDCFIFHTIE